MIAVDIADLNMGSFCESESTTVDGRQTSSVPEDTNRRQHAFDFLLTEDERQLSGQSRLRV